MLLLLLLLLRVDPAVGVGALVVGRPETTLQVLGLEPGTQVCMRLAAQEHSPAGNCSSSSSKSSSSSSSRGCHFWITQSHQRKLFTGQTAVGVSSSSSSSRTRRCLGPMPQPFTVQVRYLQLVLFFSVQFAFFCIFIQQGCRTHHLILRMQRYSLNDP